MRIFNLMGSNSSYLVGGTILCGERGTLLRCWMITSLGDTTVMLEVLIDFAGDKKTLPRTIFSWLLAEDNPVISW